MRQNCNKTAEKVLNYKDLTTEIQSMWNVKTKVIGIRIGGKLEPSQDHPENI